MNRIKELRQKNNLTLKELGKKVGMKDNTISQYETGKREPKLETWQKLANCLNVSVPYLQGIEPKANPEKLLKKLIPKLHKEYFDNYLLLNGKIPKHSFSINPEITTTLDKLITIKNLEKPISFYSKDNKEFKLNPKIEKYWFDFLIPFIKEMSDKGWIDGGSSIYLVITFLNKKLKIYEMENRKISPLESCLLNSHYFAYEEALHHLMNTSIKYSNFKEAKKNFKKYFEYLSEIKDSFFSKSEDELLREAFTKRAKMETRYIDKSIVKVIKEQVENGDDELALFLIGTGKNWEDAYNDYQSKNRSKK